MHNPHYPNLRHQREHCAGRRGCHARRRGAQKQVTNDFRPVWGTDAELTIVPKGTQPSNGSWWLVLLDDSDQANARGHHDLTTEGLPIAKVFAASALKAGTSWTVTASHELQEMLGDPNIIPVFVQNGNTAGILYA